MDLSQKISELKSLRDQLIGQIIMLEEMMGKEPEGPKQNYKFNPDGTVDVPDWHPAGLDQGRVLDNKRIMEEGVKIEKVKTDVYTGDARVHYIGTDSFDDNPSTVVNI